ncbi:hypothetical protein H8356DRAFT_1353114 [Neocallimastix lanati (nom. inval.)]|nr:hypothetical protein H8356DRAFT_1353114 [Neocallimastix sp. JGI-2020a]
MNGTKSFKSTSIKESYKYGISIGDKYCCGGFFADDIVLLNVSEGEDHNFNSDSQFKPLSGIRISFKQKSYNLEMSLAVSIRSTSMMIKCSCQKMVTKNLAYNSILIYNKLTKLNNIVHNLIIENEIVFGINIMKILQLDMNHLPCTIQDIYYGIPFIESLDLKPIMTSTTDVKLFSLENPSIQYNPVINSCWCTSRSFFVRSK